VTHLRQIMLEELERRNYAPGTIRAYIRTVEHFAQHFHCHRTCLSSTYSERTPT
jgi:integrase/recombinase XerD